MNRFNASQEKLLLACRQGNLDEVRHLLEDKQVNVNFRDRWDSTPLYYACLCGHQAVVEYLLQQGAACEENTFDGERCVYGALTDQISNLLRSYRALTFRIASRNPYEDTFRRLMESGQYSDMEFVFRRSLNEDEDDSSHNETKEEVLKAHKCILMARCPYFFEQFMNKWHGKYRIPVKRSSGITRNVMSLLLQFIYTGRLEIPVALVDVIERVAYRLGLHYLSQLIRLRYDEMNKYFQNKSLKFKWSIFPFQDQPSNLRSDFSFLAKHALPSETLPQFAYEMPFPEEQILVVPDVIFDVEGHQFNCHKVFMCGRSEYFSALMSFQYDVIERVVHVTSIPVQIFIHIVNFIYQDSCDPADIEEALILLDYAEMCFLPGLKSQLASFLEKNCLSLENACVLFCASREHKLTKLESVSSSFMAKNVEYFVQDETFRDLVLSDASSLHVREEIDTIDVIDQIRYHLSLIDNLSDCEVATKRMALLDSFLEDMNLIA